jgi:hypothetical protein
MAAKKPGVRTLTVPTSIGEFFERCEAAFAKGQSQFSINIDTAVGIKIIMDEYGKTFAHPVTHDEPKVVPPRKRPRRVAAVGK